MEVKTKERTFKKLGFNKEESADIVITLNELLANYNVHYQKLRNYHWNVTGPDFFDLHEKFEELYDKAKLNIDEVAERVRVFGHVPVSTMKDYLSMSKIEETGTDLKPEAMVEEVLNDMEIIVGYLTEVTDQASQVGDVGTVDMVNSMIKDLETEHWFLTAFLGKTAN